MRDVLCVACCGKRLWEEKLPLAGPRRKWRLSRGASNEKRKRKPMQKHIDDRIKCTDGEKTGEIDACASKVCLILHHHFRFPARETPEVVFTLFCRQIRDFGSDLFEPP